ncbi:MAG: hypothetical protein ACRDGV_01685 [Candidatus Limnocylindria bacterium]
MSTATLWRLAGLSALLGGALYVLFDALSIWDVGGIPPEDVARFGILAISSALSLGGLIGVYGIQSRESGALGLIGFVAAFVGALLSFGVGWGGVMIVPEILDTPFVRDGPTRDLAIWVLGIRLPLTAIGFLVLAIATLRAQVLSRAGAWIMLVGALLGALNTLGILALPGPLRGPALGGTGFAWLGLSVMRIAGVRPAAGRQRV